MKDRTRSGRQSNDARKENNRRTRRKAQRQQTQPYRLHRKGCKICREATKAPDKVLTESEIQTRRCPAGQQLYLSVCVGLSFGKKLGVI